MNSIKRQQIKRSALAVGATALFGFGVLGAVTAQNFDSDVTAADVIVKGDPRPAPEPAEQIYGTQAIVMGEPALTGKPKPYPGGVPNRIPE